MSSVAVITPIYREALSADEEYAIRHLRTHLSGYDCYQLSPKTLLLRLEDLRLRSYDDQWFESIEAYNRLLLSKWFYEDFDGYDYILIYQLDCLVFRDELQWWSEQGYDYIGAPLFSVKGEPVSGFSGACNGGLSLRRVNAFLNVLASRRYVDEKVSFLADVFHKPFVEVRPSTWLKRWQKRFQVSRQVRQGVEKYAASYSVNEDHFWSGRASYFYPTFRVASPEVALRFAFETAPAWCFEQNGRKLPFGVHAWAKYDRAFCEPYLLT
jgi:hypothetical protein